MPTSDPPIDLDHVRRVSRLIWTITAAMTILLWGSYAAAGLSLELQSGKALLPVIPACMAVALFYRTIRPDPWISMGAETAAQLLLILLLGTLISFAAAATGFAYKDPELYALDRAMGFDWLAYLQFFNAHPWLGVTAKLAYASMKPQTPLIIFALVIGAHFARLQQFIVATALALLITIAIFAFTPAVAYYAYLGVSPAEFANLAPTVPYEHIRHLEGIRTGAIRVVHLGDLEGLITFPSFHTSAALLFAWAAWPVRWLRWPLVVLNVLMVAATPIDGAHYLVDVIAGLGVAIGSILVAGKICAALARKPAPFLPGWATGPITHQT